MLKFVLLKPGVIESFLPIRRFLSLWLCLLVSPAFAQVSFTTVANTKDMGKTDYVQIQFKIDNAKQIDGLQPPAFPDFNVVEGPSESTGMSIINGVASQSRSISFVLQPKHAGKFTIRGATATIDGNKMSSNPVTINVRNVASYGNSQPLNNFSPLPGPAWPSAEPEVDVDEVIRPGENVADKIRKNFFIKVDLSKKECYLGEPIVVTYKLYSRLHSDSRVSKNPSLNGFSVYDMLDPGDDHSYVEKVNGKNFRVHVIRKAQLIALQAGDIPLDPVEIDNTIYFVKVDRDQSSGTGSLLDRFFDQGPQGTPFSQHVTLDSKPVTVHVKPLPEAQKPADFSGAVGRFSIQASVDSKEIDTGDAATLTVTIKGNGNLPMVNAPAVEWPADMESYDVSSKEDINKASAPLGGSKKYSYSFTCSKTGKFVIPPVRLNYFDPALNAYKTVQSDPVHIQINHAAKRKAAPAPLISVPTKGIAGGWLKNIFWIIGGILIGGLGIYFLMQKKRVSTPVPSLVNQEPVPAEPEPLPVIDPLQESKELAGSGDYGKFYASVNRAIWKAVSDKLQLPASQLNKFNISTGLRSAGWRDEDIIRLKDLLNECEMKLYT
ncbi:MAG TPA: BatD family protein, partial [Puia sp.]